MVAMASTAISAPPAARVPTSAPIAKLRAHLDARLGSLISERFSFWIHWQEIAKYLIPRRYKWLVTPNQGNRGSPINQAIIDNTAGIALRTCAAGMMSGMTSPGRPWFRYTIDNLELREVPAVKLWLDEVTRRMLIVFAESNFYTTLATMYSDLGSFGTFAGVIKEDFDDVIRFYPFCAGEYCLENDKRLHVSTCYRQFVQTIGQVVNEFGLENCSASVRSAYENGGAALAREIIVCHAIEPNNDRLAHEMGAMRRFPFRETYWEYGSTQDTMLRITGLHEESLIAPRWDIVGNDAYGRSPGMDALGDIKQLQVEQKRKAQAIDKMVNPPMVADAALKNEPASLLPGGVTYVASTGGVGFKPAYEVKPEISALLEDMNEVRGRIKATWFYDIFLMISQMEGVQPRNDLEILERKEEKLIQLGPVVERFENECLSPAIERTFNIMLRAGLIPPPPKELQGQHVHPQYVSPLALAQKAAMTTGLERLATFVGRISAGENGVQGVGPEAMDNIDWDEMTQQYADMMGVPEKVMKPFAVVLQIRAARAKQQQAAQAMQASQAAVDGAKTLSETQVGGGQSALGMMMGGAAAR